MMSFGAADAIAATGSVKLHEPSGQTVIVAACACPATALSVMTLSAIVWLDEILKNLFIADSR
jgi:hypothetical protein